MLWRTVLLLTLAGGVPAALPAQPSADSAAIRATALDYIAGWYAGDAARMERALHPKLAKRILAPASERGPAHVVETTALELVQQTRRGGGTSTPASQQRTEVRILDVFDRAASVRIDAGTWVDYLHLVKDGERWVILNVLWALRSGAGS